jgi:hypothetical protein
VSRRVAPLIVAATLSSVAVAAVILPSAPAFATISGPHTLTVSCNGTYIATGVKVNHKTTGTFKITQNSSAPTSSTVTWAVSDAGNSLSTKVVSDGTTATWTSVLPSGYTVKAYRNGKANCNGILPGDGNYTWNYKVEYNG